MATQMKPKERREQILAEAVRQAASVGYQNIARDKIAAALDISPALVSRHMGTMPDLKAEVLRTVCARAKGDFDPSGTCAFVASDMTIIAQALVAKERRALRLPTLLQKMALQSLHS